MAKPKTKTKPNKCWPLISSKKKHKTKQLRNKNKKTQFPFSYFYSCIRLNLVPLAYLWRRDQTELLQEMIDCQVYAIIIKVASLGLVPDRHLGKTLREMQPHLIKMKEKYGLNVCGEGGEYETFTLDCPLFKKRICM